MFCGDVPTLPRIFDGGRPQNCWRLYGLVRAGDFCLRLLPQVLSAGCRTIEGSPSRSVLVPLERAALLSIAGLKLSIQKLTGHAIVVHPDDMCHPSQLGLDEYSFNAGTPCTVQDLEICDTVIPSDVKYGTEGTYVEILQLFEMPAVQSPSLASIQERGQDYSSVDFQLRKLKPSLACKIFDTMIVTYNSEIWGVYTKPQFKAWDSSQIEKTHLQFCKRYLEVSNKASNITCKAELGRFPLNIAINQRILNYMLYLKNKKEDSFVKQSFLMSLVLLSASKDSFHPNLMKMSEYFNLNNFNPDLLDTAKIKHFVSLMKQKYISHWQQALQHSQKLEFYKYFKNEYAPSNCLEHSTRTSERRALTKLRTSNHKRMIELGRCNQISRDNS